jgi:hypothetical protein
MERSMKANGMIASQKEMGFSLMLMDQGMKDLGEKANGKGMELK